MVCVQSLVFRKHSLLSATESTRPEKESAVHHLDLFQAALIEISNNIDQSEMKSKHGFQALSGSLEYTSL